MQTTLATLYPWLKAGHIIFIVFWMAGLFMLPRQMIYASLSPTGSEEEALWAKRMGQLRSIILTPSIVAVWVFGILLAIAINAWGDGWLHAKLLIVLLLSGYHGFMVAKAKRIAAGQRPMTDRQLRMWGEAPALALVLIVVLVVVKPF